MKSAALLSLILVFCLLLSGCANQPGRTAPGSGNSTDASADTHKQQSGEEPSPGDSSAEDSELKPQELGSVTAGTETYRGFVIDNVYYSPNDGEIHYNVYIPESYDGSHPYALFFTLPGYEGLYFQGVARNLEAEAFGFEAQKYNEEMIVVAPQLSDWRETSANQTVALLEYFLAAYNIDREKIYANGYSGGGETMSLVMGKRPELFTAYLHCSSQWDGDLEVLAESRTPVYLAIGEDDEYYGSEPTKRAYDTLRGLYEQQGLTSAEIGELLVLDVKDDSYFRDRGMNNQHGGGGLFAYDENIMGWLFGK